MEVKRLNKTFRIVGTAIFLMNIFVSSISAQTAGGTILGKVTDLTGAILPGVAITIRNSETGITRALLTGETGVYDAANLQPGIYQVTAEMTAFSVGLKKDISLKVGSEVVIDFQLKVASVTSSVDVTAEDTQVDQIASTVNRAQQRLHSAVTSLVDRWVER
jgi:hypothetical protein